MKEELQSKLVEILTSIQTATGKAADFAMEQLPDIAQSYIAYGRVMGLIGVLLPLLVAIIVLCIGWAVHRSKSAGKGYYDPFMVWFPTTLVSGICVFASTTNIQSAVLVWMAPKVWLLKQIASMVSR